MTTATRFASRLEALLGADCVSVTDEAQDYAIDRIAPRAIVRPATSQEITQLAQFALSEKLALVPCGSRSKLELGMPPERYDIAVDVTRLKSVAHYDPADLTMSVDAGVPLRELAEFLAQHNQFLPLAVPCFEASTVGGAIASGIDSALRQAYGTPRDFLIGAEFVDGSGQLCKSGGRVVKNVTGYDLHKLLIGSLGTLGIITRLNFRTFPRAEGSNGVLTSFANIEDALAFRADVESSSTPLNNLEILSPEAASILGAILSGFEKPLLVSLPKNEWSVYASFEGPGALLERIAGDLQSLAADNRATQHQPLDTPSDEAIGGMLRESFEWLRWAAPQVALLKVVDFKTSAATVQELARAAEANSMRHALLVRSAGIMYLALLAKSEDPSELELLTKTVMAAIQIARGKGYAKILHAPPAVKEASLQWIRAGLNLEMEKRVKRAFDPQNIFAPGRIVGAG